MTLSRAIGATVGGLVSIFILVMILGSTKPAPEGVAQAKALSCKIEISQWRIRRADYDTPRLVGEIVNHCPQALGVQLKMTIHDADGLVIDTDSWWPASIRNIEPEKPFAFTHMLLQHVRTFDSSWDVAVEIIDRRHWDPL